MDQIRQRQQEAAEDARKRALEPQPVPPGLPYWICDSGEVKIESGTGTTSPTKRVGIEDPEFIDGIKRAVDEKQREVDFFKTPTKLD